MAKRPVPRKLAKKRALILEARQTPDLERQYHLNMEMEKWEDEFEARRQILLELESSDLVQEALRWSIDVNLEWACRTYRHGFTYDASDERVRLAQTKLDA